MSEDRFYFTVTDVGRFLGKSPVTLRAWEKKGEIVFARDVTGTRTFDLEAVRATAIFAHKLRRVSLGRLQMIEAALTILAMLERES